MKTLKKYLFYLLGHLLALVLLLIIAMELSLLLDKYFKFFSLGHFVFLTFLVFEKILMKTKKTQDEIFTYRFCFYYGIILSFISVFNYYVI